ncbi:MAG TPA: PSD1 and planctomycete cytochrome C domain-containing protein [Opitutaceae bacterium]|nr:PSD1 and planctomycete cytochrome C domain-containing protein [Opitutaceae bacterium]
MAARFRFLRFLPLLLPVPVFGTGAAIDYLRDVKPILTQHCVRCHGETKEEAGLRIDTAEAMKLGGESGSVTKRRHGRESLLIEVVTGTHEDIPRMPYKKPALSAEQIETLRDWVAQGAKAPEVEEPGRFIHWAFVPPSPPKQPQVKKRSWVRNPIDRFILARLEKEGIKPSPEADRVTLLRRVSLDLTGIPPTPDEVDAFLRDSSKDAYERVVERLLASPRYGERWGRTWLDVARYSDSDGYSVDSPRQIWKYRDWVVNAFNRDMPFDEFVIEQLAGDLLPDATIEQRVATGFNRNTQINQEGGIDPEQFRTESVIDRVNTYGTAFLGLTVSCAQCHDHKFDPLTQKEYYQLFAFFNNSPDDGHGQSKATGQLEFPNESALPPDHESKLTEARIALTAYLDEKAGQIANQIAQLTPEGIHALKQKTQDALKIPVGAQSLEQRRDVFFTLNGADTTFLALNQTFLSLDRAPRFVTTLVMSELPEPRDTFLFINGDFTRHGEKVAAGTPVELPPLDKPHPNRLDLARWTVDPGNPLTARVAVNRIWQQYWGRGLVETENDFGTQGDPPSHPELLDWLATEFIAQGWSMKAVHRLIVTSASYRQSSKVRNDLQTSDPLNKLCARQNRLRLDAEIIRDVCLSVSGLLSTKMGGPPVYPPQPDGVMSLGQVKRAWVESTGEDRHRRGLYTQRWRGTFHPAFAVFDAPDGATACTRRLRSNTPLQALTLLNDPQYHEFSQALARRIFSMNRGSVTSRIDTAFRLCLARRPDRVERKRLVQLYEQQLKTASGSDEERRLEAWEVVSRVLLNLDETITRE